jgi:DNA-binding SARP family transcriptional activator
LIADVWRNEPPPAAKATLHSHIRNLRRVLEPGRTAGTSSGVLVTRPPGYEIRVAADRMDAWRFERLADEARAALDDGDPRSAADRYRAALALWRGAAYGDLADEEFVQSEAARLEALRLVAIEQRVQADLDLGRHAELCGELSALVKDNPYRERFWGQLMLAQYRSGRQTDALRTYRQVRSQLGEELGIEPGQDLRDLDGAIVQHHPGLDWSADAGHDVSPSTPPPEGRARHNLPAGLTRFVGRDDERRHLVEELAAHRLVTVTGVGGVGKTRLAAEIASSLIDVHDDGVWMVELAPIADPADVPGAIASALSIPIQPGMNSVESIVDWMRGRRLLLVVDNCEHVLTAAVELVGAIVARCPTVTMLTTSRELCLSVVDGDRREGEHTGSFHCVETLNARGGFFGRTENLLDLIWAFFQQRCHDV